MFLSSILVGLAGLHGLVGSPDTVPPTVVVADRDYRLLEKIGSTEVARSESDWEKLGFTVIESSQELTILVPENFANLRERRGGAKLLDAVARACAGRDWIEAKELGQDERGHVSKQLALFGGREPHLTGSERLGIFTTASLVLTDGTRQIQIRLEADPAEREPARVRELAETPVRFPMTTLDKEGREGRPVPENPVASPSSLLQVRLFGDPWMVTTERARLSSRALEAVSAWFAETDAELRSSVRASLDRLGGLDAKLLGAAMGRGGPLSSLPPGAQKQLANHVAENWRQLGFGSVDEATAYLSSARISRAEGKAYLGMSVGQSNGLPDIVRIEIGRN
jgi:hypothetical protein